MTARYIKFKKAFTLIELLVVIAIITVLAGAVLYSTNNAREKARDKQRKESLEAIRTAAVAYYTDNNTFPEVCNPPDDDDPNPELVGCIETVNAGDPTGYTLASSDGKPADWFPTINQYLANGNAPIDPLQIIVEDQTFAEAQVGKGSDETCSNTAVKGLDPNDNGQTPFIFNYDAGTGNLVQGVCIKSGEDAFTDPHYPSTFHSPLLGSGTYENGCYTISGVATQHLSISRNSTGPNCKDISHFDIGTFEAQSGGGSGGGGSIWGGGFGSLPGATKGDASSNYYFQRRNDGKYFVIWAKLENQNDPQKVGGPNATCDLTPPDKVGTGAVYCIASPPL